MAYTSTLRDHEVKGRGYMECTDEAYRKLFDAPAWQLRQRRNLPKGTNLRDKMDIVELSAIKLTEALATQRITKIRAKIRNARKLRAGPPRMSGSLLTVRCRIDRSV
jgi:hypothetical protein